MWKKAFFSIIEAVKQSKHAHKIARHLAQNALYERKGVNALYPDIKDKYILLEAKMKELSMPIKLFEGFRSAKRQNSLSSKVTNAKELQSYHQFCLAFDVNFRQYGWKPPKGWWDILGKEGEKLGLTWGGRWKMRDYPHFELHEGFTWRDLRPYLIVL